MASLPNEVTVCMQWFGFGYACNSSELPDGGSCAAALMPFGLPAPSYNAPGWAADYSITDVVEALPSSSGRRLDPTAVTAFASFTLNGTAHSVFYDDASTIEVKVQYAAAAGARGVGVYSATYLDYSKEAEAAAMWAALSTSRLKHKTDDVQAEIQRKHAEQQDNMAKDAAKKQKEAQKAAAESAYGHADGDNSAALFNMVDEDKSGDQSVDELFQALQETGSPPENDEEMLELMDPDNNRLITLSEWTTVWTQLESSLEQEEAERRCAAGDEQWCYDILPQRRGGVRRRL